MTFPSLVEEFYTKAERAGVNLRPNLDFMFQISKELKDIKRLLGKPMESLNFNSDVVKNVMRAVPVDRLIGRASRNVKDRTDLIIVQTRKIAKLNSKIYSKIDLKLTHETTDYEFIHTYDDWNSDAADVYHLKQVKNSIKSMKSVNNRFLEKLKEEFKDVSKRRSFCSATMKLINTAFLELSQSNESNQIEAKVGGLESHLVRMNSELTNMIITLGNIEIRVNEYNAQRVKWADVLIGLRDFPTAIRKTKDMKKIMAARNLR